MNDLPILSPSPGSSDGSSPKRPAPKPHVKRRALADGGGIKGQLERHQDLKQHWSEQYYKGLRNPKLPFKDEHALAAEYGVTSRTILNDVAYFQNREELPVDFIESRGGFGYLEEVKSFSGDEFTRGEYLALWLSVKSFEAWGGLPHQKRMPTILRKLKASGAAMDPAQLRAMRQSVTFKAGGFQAPVDQEIFETVLQALLKKEKLQFGYLSLDQRRALREQPASSTASAVIPKTPEVRCVLPLHLLCWDYAWYLFAWDPARKDIRTFALGRMSGATLTGKQFDKVPVKFDLRKELEQSFGITRGGKSVPVHLRFQPRAVPLIVERLWHPSQEMIENEDGTLDLTMKVAIVPELVRWVQSWGADIAILEPTSLDDLVLDACRKRLEEAARRRGL
jgi:predicted DNA-binding transcriptional regulator YafY